MTRFTASSLEEIAVQFQRRAQEEYTRAERSKTRLERVACENRASTWTEAAAFLRSTTLTKPEIPNAET